MFLSCRPFLPTLLFLLRSLHTVICWHSGRGQGGGRLGPRMWGKAEAVDHPQSRVSARPCQITGQCWYPELELFCKGNRRLGSQPAKSFKTCFSLQSDVGSKDSPVLAVSVKDIKDWEVLRNEKYSNFSSEWNICNIIFYTISILQYNKDYTRNHRQRQTVHSGGNC